MSANENTNGQQTAAKSTGVREHEGDRHSWIRTGSDDTFRIPESGTIENGLQRATAAVDPLHDVAVMAGEIARVGTLKERWQAGGLF